MNNFWQKLKKPIFVLAPMADVTDAAFRRVIAKYGKPDVMWTEFVSADGLARAPLEGRKKLLKDFRELAKDGFSESMISLLAKRYAVSDDAMRIRLINLSSFAH